MTDLKDIQQANQSTWERRANELHAERDKLRAEIEWLKQELERTRKLSDKRGLYLQEIDRALRPTSPCNISDADTILPAVARNLRKERDEAECKLEVMRANKGVFRCRKCGCLWRLIPPNHVQPEGSWSLYDAKQKPEKCCDNAPMITRPSHDWNIEISVPETLAGIQADSNRVVVTTNQADMVSFAQAIGAVADALPVEPDSMQLPDLGPGKPMGRKQDSPVISQDHGVTPRASASVGEVGAGPQGSDSPSAQATDCPVGMISDEELGRIAREAWVHANLPNDTADWPAVGKAVLEATRSKERVMTYEELNATARAVFELNRVTIDDLRATNQGLLERLKIAEARHAELIERPDGKDKP